MVASIFFFFYYLSLRMNNWLAFFLSIVFDIEIYKKITRKKHCLLEFKIIMRKEYYLIESITLNNKLSFGRLMGTLLNKIKNNPHATLYFKGKHWHHITPTHTHMSVARTQTPICSFLYRIL
jgi:hypothetical protein